MFCVVIPAPLSKHILKLYHELVLNLPMKWVGPIIMGDIGHWAQEMTNIEEVRGLLPSYHAPFKFDVFSGRFIIRDL